MSHGSSVAHYVSLFVCRTLCLVVCLQENIMSHGSSVAHYVSLFVCRTLCLVVHL